MFNSPLIRIAANNSKESTASTSPAREVDEETLRAAEALCLLYEGPQSPTQPPETPGEQSDLPSYRP